MNPRRTRLVSWLLVFAVTVTLSVIAVPAGTTLAQADTPQPAAGTPDPLATPGTPTPTRTPTLTPTPTSTLTALGAKLVLAQAYLDGHDYARAAALFAEVAQEDRGNPEALAGLTAALDAQVALRATAQAPTPEILATPVPEPAPPSLAGEMGARLREFLSLALSAILVIFVLYLLAGLMRWLIGELREIWYLRILPLVGRPAVQPGYLIGEFTNGLGEAGANAARLVPMTITEKLLAWNQLVQATERPVSPEPALDLGGMGWLRVLWGWILPAPRGYRITGALFQDARGAYQLGIQRTSLARNTVDLSTTLDQSSQSLEAAYRAMAGEAAKWLVSPDDMAASDAVQAAQPDTKGALPVTPGEVFDQTLELLLPVRRQIQQGAVNHADARTRIRNTEALLARLPEGSHLRVEVETIIADLRRSVPAG